MAVMARAAGRVAAVYAHGRRPAGLPGVRLLADGTVETLSYSGAKRSYALETVGA